MIISEDELTKTTNNAAESIDRNAFERPMASDVEVRDITLDPQQVSNLQADIKSELVRISDEIIGDTVNNSNLKTFQYFFNTLRSVKTSSQLLSFVQQKNSLRRGRKIKVQPPSISRRTYKGRGGGRVQSGRPAANETKRKREHNISASIDANVPHSKKH